MSQTPQSATHPTLQFYGDTDADDFAITSVLNL